MDSEDKLKAEKGREKDRERKQIVLRLSASLWEEIARWAEDDFRSINGQIEYLLTECVKWRKRKKKDRGECSGDEV